MGADATKLDAADFAFLCKQAGVTPLQEEAMRLRLVDGLPDRDAAKRLGVTLSTYRMRISRGRREVREAMDLFQGAEHLSLLVSTLALLGQSGLPRAARDSGEVLARHLLQVIKGSAPPSPLPPGPERAQVVTVEDIGNRYDESWRSGPDFWQALKQPERQIRHAKQIRKQQARKPH